MKRIAFLVPLLSALVSLGLLTGCEVYSFEDDDDDDAPPAATTGGGRKKLIGTWDVETPWRWTRITLHADGSRSVTDASGNVLHRGSWHLEGDKLVIVSDVTEKWDYTVSGSTLTVTPPSGNQLKMTKVN
jgi:hypothetical protein